jgi:ATP-dependent Clp protease adaptor protein ClpS
MAKSYTEDDTIVKIKPRLDIPMPSMYKVIYLNDEQTSFEFVIESLMSIFDHDEDSAMTIAGAIHEHGSAVVAILTYELAEHKSLEVTTLARNNGFPLRVKIEQDI